jgi:hypothetical protein
MADEGDVMAGEKSKKKKHLKAKLTVLTFGIFAVSFGGLWTWHAQPSFCATLCHNTMSTYYEGYVESDLLVNDHADADVACLDCHEADISTQMKEFQVQLSGEYRLPLAKMATDDSFCLRDGCHTRDEIVAATADYTAGAGTNVSPHEITVDRNAAQKQDPHNSGAETIACSTCHTSHRPSAEIRYCYDACHHTETFEVCSDCHAESTLGT